jgi:D-alanine-D-alanine ligase
VLILAGGLSHERDVSLRSGRRVAQALREAECSVIEADLGSDLLDLLRSSGADLVWPLLHGASGEDGSVRDVLEMAGAPYLGSDPRASRTAWNKAIAKTVIRRAGGSTPDFVTLPQSLFREIGAPAMLELVTKRFGLPLVVKPVHGGSALGVTVAENADSLPGAFMDAFAYGPVALVEQAVDGVELAVSVVDLGDGPLALPAVEIVTDGTYDFDARYNPGRSEFFVPARICAADAERAGELAVLAHQALGLARISRTDMILDRDGGLWFLEVNVAPGMQETSLLPQAAQAAGYFLPDLYRKLVEASIKAPKS